MKRKSMPVLITVLLVVAAMNFMCFILKATSISRITCVSFDQAITQNKIHVILFFISVVGVVLLGRYHTKQIKKNEKEKLIEIKQDY